MNDSFNEILANERDIAFQLFEVLDTESLCERERFKEHSQETFKSVLDTARRIAEEKFAPHNAYLDSNEPSFDGERVSMPSEVKEAYRAIADAGFIAGRELYEYGGMQLPETLMTMAMGYFTSANASTAGYPFLTIAAANLINTFASDELKRRYYPAMLKGDFSGTMALTEPHAGSSLADIRSKASPTEKEGVYRIKGNKMYISGGDHELTDNIVHLVLAKIEGAPTGVKGISLFLVPKFDVDANGNFTHRNDVSLAGLIHKLGYRGTTSTALNFGENDQCIGYLIGEPHQGLRYMFKMMNEARVGVAMGATMIGYRGYLYSLHYAKERVQGRLSQQSAESEQVAIVQHPDVRRMLLAQKSYVEGALSLCLYGARLLDDQHTHSDEKEAQKASILIDLLTPIIKSWCSEFGPKANDLAIQILGGAGYTREYPVEQYWRDNRLNPIHEGTNGIQALDLLGRKVWQNQGAGLKALAAEMLVTIQASQSLGGRVSEWASTLQTMIGKVSEVTAAVGIQLQKDIPEKGLSNAQAYMSLVSKLVIAWMWLRQANAAASALADNANQIKHSNLSEADVAFYEGKLQAAQYFFHVELPQAEVDATLILNQDDTHFAMKEGWF